VAVRSSLLSKIRNRPIRRILDLAAGVASERGLEIFLAGGCVRDLLLGVPLRDIDLVVEGDPLAVSRGLAASTGARATRLTPFGTSRVETPSGVRIDIAMSRRETYASPAALPQVRPASIEEDLLRRDFTFNSMALRLAGPRRGELLDPSGGLRDLGRRILRLHHPGSVADDPTRAFRAARFATRYSLKPAPSFFEALSSRDASRAFASLGPARLLREIRLIWGERDPAAVLALLSRWGLLARVDPSLRFTVPLARAVRRAAGTRGEGAEHAEASDLLLALLAWSLLPRRRGGLCARLGLMGASRREILLPAAAPALARAHRPTFAVAAKMAEWPETAYLIVRAVESEGTRRAIDRSLRRWRTTRPLLRGDDLIGLGIPPGPRVGLLLRELRRRRFDGRFRTRAEETRWIKAHS
jgi:tRNA nucleotidyltransferase (CCA-adding enzyme)